MATHFPVGPRGEKLTLAELQSLSFTTDPATGEQIEPGGESGTLLDFAEQMRALGQEGEAESLLGEFYQWALDSGISNPNPGDLQQTNQFISFRNAETQRSASSGSVGRTQFASERRLQNQQSESLRFGRELDLSSFMENLKQMAFDRLKDKQQLLLDVDVIMDARRSGYTSALQAALPFILPEGMTQFPGAELDKRLGIDSNLNIPRVELPIGDFLNAPLNVDVGAIQSLDTSTVQQPRQV